MHLLILKHKKIIISLAVIILLIIAITVYFGNRNSQSQNPAKYSISDMLKEQQDLKDIISKDGLEKAYKVFLSRWDLYDPAKRHYLGHFMGVAIFNLRGENGISLCDTAKEYGCIHGFIMQGYEKEGKAYLSKVATVCSSIKEDSIRIKCIHGLSHVLLYMKGYSQKNLLDTLMECRDMFEKENSVCFHGAFMEYNFRTVDGEETGKWYLPREAEPSKMLEPCSFVPSIYQRYCYIEQPSLWQESITRDYIKMSNYCDQVKSDKPREGCFIGLGRVMSEEKKHVSGEIGKVCQSMPQKRDVLSCIEGSLIILLHANVSDAYKLCDYVSSDMRKECIIVGEDFSCKELGQCRK